jgi:hypothetical protein
LAAVTVYKVAAAVVFSALNSGARFGPGNQKALKAAIKNSCGIIAGAA